MSRQAARVFITGIAWCRVPPTAVDPDDVELDLNLVTGSPLAMPNMRHVQNNAFGFGGNNAISIFRSVS